VVEDCYLAGFLHDVGVLVLGEHVPRTFLATMAVSMRRKRPICEVEQKSAGITHADVGGYLAALWGLPSRIVQAISLHHRPGISTDQGFAPLAAVHVASAVDEERFPDVEGAVSPIDLEYIERLGLSGRLDTWREVCRSVQSQGAYS
jgi:HD-like signal output (HDOD) protein